MQKKGLVRAKYITAQLHEQVNMTSFKLVNNRVSRLMYKYKYMSIAMFGILVRKTYQAYD